MHLQLAVFCLVAVSMVIAGGSGDDCSLNHCERYFGVYRVTLTESGSEPSYELWTFYSDGFYKATGSYLGPASPTFQGILKCTTGNTVELNDFGFDPATAQFPQTLGKGIFKLQFYANNRFTGTLGGTSYDLASTENPNPSKWIEVTNGSLIVSGYKLLKGCNN